MSNLTANYFAPGHYVQSDIQSCLLQNRQGDRLIALPEQFLLALDESLHEETGRAASFALYTCGTIWGEGFYQRFADQMTARYSLPMSQIQLIPFLLAMREYFAVHGFGILGLDFSRRQQGVIVVSLENSIVAPNTVAPSSQGRDKVPACHLEAGIFAGWFSAWTSEPLTSLQTACISQVAPKNMFLIAKTSRLQPVKAWVQSNLTHAQILERLCP
jgi:uncharacterized protein